MIRPTSLVLLACAIAIARPLHAEGLYLAADVGYAHLSTPTALGAAAGTEPSLGLRAGWESEGIAWEAGFVTLGPTHLGVLDLGRSRTLRAGALMRLVNDLTEVRLGGGWAVHSGDVMDLPGTDKADPWAGAYLRRHSDEDFYFELGAEAYGGIRAVRLVVLLGWRL